MMKGSFGMLEPQLLLLLDGYEPSIWIFDDSDSDYFNANPWVPIYPWGETQAVQQK